MTIGPEPRIRIVLMSLLFGIVIGANSVTIAHLAPVLNRGGKVVVFCLNLSLTTALIHWTLPLTMSLLITSVAVLAVWLAVTIPLWVVSAHLRRVGQGNDAFTATMCWANWLYVKKIHHASFEGLEIIPKTNNPGGLIVVSNHRSPIDPMLLQAMCPFEIRWMIARDSMNPSLNWLWKRQRHIPVDRDGRDTASLRTAIRHVRSGGVLSVFPEGAIAKPHGKVCPFHTGVGFMIAKTKAPVLLTWIAGTPLPYELGPALKTPSYSKVVFIDLIDFSSESDPVVITNQLRSRIAEFSGWPICDDPLPPIRPKRVDPFSGLTAG